MCKLGDKTYKLYEKDMEKDLAKEEEQKDKIRILLKEKLKSRNAAKAPPPPSKRRKLEDASYSSNADPVLSSKIEAVKRKRKDQDEPAV